MTATSPSNSIVVVPTCNRPEFLALCLRRLDETPERPEVLICADTAANLDEVEYVRDTYLPEADILHAKAHISTPSGCWNILMSIKEGFKLRPNVFLVEEDTMVYPNFFEWHYAQTGADVSCGRIVSQRFPKFSPNWYTNPGSFLRQPALDKLVPHINNDYFSRLRGYLDEHFGPHDEWSELDDGLIRRVVGDVVVPEHPVCAHQGFRAYNRLDIYMNRGTIQERIARLEPLLASIKPGDRYALDFEPYNP